ncbi:unnamed protein product [Rotaria sordida]|uniref:Uncharacterized protein n=1 Tax=Rotaria sordida TaxID=392033 RepID=A0A816EKX3_9BILA|nr:unnamed protein product [Rotaria sordida]CAF1650634.1 unnamed protein product [Rotaria sordida]
MKNSSNSISIIWNIKLLNSINEITIDLNSEHQQTVLTNEFLSDLLICPVSIPSTSSLTSLSTLLSNTTTPTQIGGPKVDLPKKNLISPLRLEQMS